MVRFSRPLAEPAVPVSRQRALRGICVSGVVNRHRQHVQHPPGIAPHTGPPSSPTSRSGNAAGILTPVPVAPPASDAATSCSVKRVPFRRANSSSGMTSSFDRQHRRTMPHIMTGSASCGQLSRLAGTNARSAATAQAGAGVGQAARVSNQTEPRSWPAVRRTSASSAAARRRSRATVGSVPPSSMHSISSVVCGAPGQVGDAQAEGGAPVIECLAEGQGLPDGEPLRIVSLGLGAPQRVW